MDIIASRPSPILDLLANMQERAKQADRHDPQARISISIQLPLFPKDEDKSAIPNYLARTPLFAPIRAARRKLHDNELLPSPNGVEIRFSGPQLDMADQDVFLLALKLAQGTNLYEPVRCNRSQFLKALGWKTSGKERQAFGKSAYEWLDQSFQRLATGTLHIKTKRYKAHLSLISEWLQDENTGQWEFIVGGKILDLFQNKEYAFIDLAKRRLLGRRVDLAKWLQSYAATHRRGLHRVKVEELKNWCGYASPIRKFREALMQALAEMERLQIVISVSFYKEQTMVQWVRLENAVLTA